MNVIHMSATPLVGVPILVSELMNKYLSGVSSRCIQSRVSYSDGRCYKKDLLYKDEETPSVIADADVVFIHNGVLNEQISKQIQNKRIVFICHSQPHHMEQKWFDLAETIAVVAQYQPRLYGDKRIALVPNLLDIEDALYKPQTKRQELTVTYAPTKLEAWPKNDPWFWDSKGYQETIACLQKARIKYLMFHKKNLKDVLMQDATCHISIDEIVTGAYHRRSLEGAAHGNLSINAMDDFSIKCMQWVSYADDVPFFIVKDFETLHGVLQQAKKVPDWVASEGKRARTWIEKYWHPQTLLEHFYLPLIVNSQIRWFC